MKKRKINFDKNSLSMPTRHTLKVLRKLYKKGYCNPNALYMEGIQALDLIEKARAQVADVLQCKPNEIFFTSGASESISWVAKNFNLECDSRSHHSVIEAAKNQRKSKNKISLLAFPLVVSETGQCIIHEYELDTKYQKYFVDLTQGINKGYYINLENTPNIICACASGQKIGGIQGCGILYIKEEYQKNITPLIYGSQENYLRGGTQNVPAIVCFGEAITEGFNQLEKRISTTMKVIHYILDNLYNIKYISRGNTINLTFKNLLATTAVQLFNTYGINISAGSACQSGIEKPNQAYLMYGLTEEEAMRTVRISVDYKNNVKEAKKFVKVLNKILREYD